MIKEDYILLEQLARHPGFKLFKQMLQERFDIEYKKLRKCKKAVTTYDRINGLLDGLELGINIVDDELKEYYSSLQNNQEQGE